jgi:dTDP-L-rhamnose 4-epimerase
MNVLITGGAGFIGTHLARKLLQDGHAVTILDNFNPQIHGGNQELYSDLAPHVKLFRADLRDDSALVVALNGQNAVIHLAAETGTGQSMCEISRYQDVNIGGTARLLEHVVKGKARELEAMIVASSRAVYGEGRYLCGEHDVQFPGARRKDDLRRGEFEPKCPRCRTPLEAIATTEDSILHPTSFYGLTKLMQERTTLMFSESLGLRAYALRYQNVYGPGQALGNPYTGILAVFSTQARSGKPIYVFEDGMESRDFVYVDDVVEATTACLDARHTQEPLNIGSGSRVTVLEIAEAIVAYFNSSSTISVNGAFRDGDIRHNFADLARARASLGFAPRWGFKDGLTRFMDWSAGQIVGASRYEDSLQEMRERGMYHA